MIGSAVKDPPPFTKDSKDLGLASIHIITVPTPVNDAKQPDLNPLLSATEIVGRILKEGDLVIYESTVYPGCIEEECVPFLEKLSGLNFLSEGRSQNSTQSMPHPPLVKLCAPCGGTGAKKHVKPLDNVCVGGHAWHEGRH